MRSPGPAVLSVALLLLVVLAACGGPVDPTSVPTQAPTPAAPTVQPSATPVRPTVTPTPRLATPTAAPETRTLSVGNTDGEGVFIRTTPRKDDRIRAWPDGTPMKVWPGETESGDGWEWLKAEDPDGNQGWIPKQFLVETSGG